MVNTHRQPNFTRMVAASIRPASACVDIPVLKGDPQVR
jgi:hypothetical protein